MFSRMEWLEAPSGDAHGAVLSGYQMGFAMPETVISYGWRNCNGAFIGRPAWADAFDD